MPDKHLAATRVGETALREIVRFTLVTSGRLRLQQHHELP